MKITTEDRLIGIEVEYLQSNRDSVLNYENEYYQGMKEINRLLLPMPRGKTLEALKMVRSTLYGIHKVTGNPLATYGWDIGNGYAFNGIHLHISHNIHKTLLTHNILKVIDKWGITPRGATSWHVRAQPSYRNYKEKRKYAPVHVTPRGTTEIRILDLEYFYNEEILKDIALAIDYSTYEVNQEVPFGSTNWFYSNSYNEDIGKHLNILETNLAPWWVKVTGFSYLNSYTGKILDFSNAYRHNREQGEGGTKYLNKLKNKSPTTSLIVPPVMMTTTLTYPKVPTTPKNRVHIQVGTKTRALPYSKDWLCTGRLVDVPLCMAVTIPIKVKGEIFNNIPNDIFYYLGITIRDLVVRPISELPDGIDELREDYINYRVASSNNRYEIPISLESSIIFG